MLRFYSYRTGQKQTSLAEKQADISESQLALTERQTALSEQERRAPLRVEAEDSCLSYEPFFEHRRPYDEEQPLMLTSEHKDAARRFCEFSAQLMQKHGVMEELKPSQQVNGQLAMERRDFKKKAVPSWLTTRRTEGGWEFDPDDIYFTAKFTVYNPRDVPLSVSRFRLDLASEGQCRDRCGLSRMGKAELYILTSDNTVSPVVLPYEMNPKQEVKMLIRFPLGVRFSWPDGGLWPPHARESGEWPVEAKVNCFYRSSSGLRFLVNDTVCESARSFGPESFLSY